MVTAESPWNSLEVVKLVVSVLTPLVLLLLGIWIERLRRDLASSQWAGQKVIERRIAVYDEAAPLLNDLLCYFTWVGNWKDFTPPQVIAIKRKLDKRMYTDRFLFPGKFIDLYFEFLSLCFETYTGVGKDARLRTSITSPDGDRRHVSPEPWDDTWNDMFSDRPETPEHVWHAYQNLMTCFSAELGIMGPRPSRS